MTVMFLTVVTLDLHSNHLFSYLYFVLNQDLVLYYDFTSLLPYYLS